MQKPDDNLLKLRHSALISDTKHLDARIITLINHVNMLLKQLEQKEIPILPVVGKVMPKENDVALPAIQKVTITDSGPIRLGGY